MKVLEKYQGKNIKVVYGDNRRISSKYDVNEVIFWAYHVSINVLTFDFVAFVDTPLNSEFI